nr:MAG TPA: hypothetical protein [Caudoviricetes sp.]
MPYHPGQRARKRKKLSIRRLRAKMTGLPAPRRGL